jgi:hypothetical protein
MPDRTHADDLTDLMAAATEAITLALALTDGRAKALSRATG